MLRTPIFVILLLLTTSLSAYADINSELIIAAGKGDIGAVLALLDMDAAVNTTDKYGVTPLMVAAANGHIDIASVLLTKGAKVSLKANNGLTALLAAEQRGYKKIVELLERAEDNKLGLMDEVKNGDLMQTPHQPKQRLRFPNFPAWNNICNYFSFQRWRELPSAIVIAVLILVIGQLIIARYKIKNRRATGVDVGTKDNKGRTPLMYAAMSGHDDIVKMLLDKGADVNARSKDGKTALSWAAMEKHSETVKILLTGGANRDKLQKKIDKIAPVLLEEGYENVHLFKKIKKAD